MDYAKNQLIEGIPTISERLDRSTPAEVKLHLGCGGETWRDFINVDLFSYDPDKPDSSRSGCVAEALGDMRNLGLKDNSIDEIFTSHTLEHFTRWEAIDMLTDWRRMLKPSGKVVMETPDFVRCVLRLFHPRRSHRQLALNMFYGNQWDRHDFETHRYVWSAAGVKRALLDIGYQSVTVTHKTETHHPGRDMQVTAIK